MSDAKFAVSRRSALLTGAAFAAAPVLASAFPFAASAAAPIVGRATPGFHRFKLGEFDIASIADGWFQREGPHPIFGAEQPADAVEKLMEANLLPPKKMEVPFTPLLINTGRELVLFDTGNGSGPRPNTGLLVANLGAAGYKPEQIDIVVITHCHGDHIGGLTNKDGPVFKNARYVMSEVEYQFWTAPERASGATEQNAKLVQAKVTPLKEKITFIKNDAEVVSGIRAIEAFGHTPGHLAFHIESAGKRLLAWVDSAHHPVVSLQQPDWTLQFDTDKAAAAATRRRMYDMAAAEKIPVNGYHMPLTGFGFVEKTGTAYRWVPATYQLTL